MIGWIVDKLSELRARSMEKHHEKLDGLYIQLVDSQVEQERFIDDGLSVDFVRGEYNQADSTLGRLIGYRLRCIYGSNAMHESRILMLRAIDDVEGVIGRDISLKRETLRSINS